LNSQNSCKIKRKREVEEDMIELALESGWIDGIGAFIINNHAHVIPDMPFPVPLVLDI